MEKGVCVCACRRTYSSPLISGPWSRGCRRWQSSPWTRAQWFGKTSERVTRAPCLTRPAAACLLRRPCPGKGHADKLKPARVLTRVAAPVCGSRWPNFLCQRDSTRPRQEMLASISRWRLALGQTVNLLAAGRQGCCARLLTQPHSWGPPWVARLVSNKRFLACAIVYACVPLHARLAIAGSGHAAAAGPRKLAGPPPNFPTRVPCRLGGLARRGVRRAELGGNKSAVATLPVRWSAWAAGVRHRAAAFSPPFNERALPGALLGRLAPRATWIRPLRHRSRRDTPTAPLASPWPL